MLRNMNKIFSLIFIFLIFLFPQIILLNANDDTYINSSNIIYDEKKNTIQLAENSKININKTNILIDKGIIDYSNDKVEVFGNFYLYEELNILSGKDLKGNIELNQFSATDVSYIYNNDMKIDSQLLERNNGIILFYDNFVTPCELDGFFNCPTWSLRIDKTEYDVEKDKFVHFDTFLQIADYKIFYLPYLSHYGAKAPRQKGFLTPSLEFSIGGKQGIVTPYYLPINISTDITIKPKIYFSESLDLLNNYEIHSVLNNRGPGGKTTVELKNIKNENTNNINNSIKFNTKNIINKNQIISASALFTNSISTTRANNEDPITFEDIYFRIENYNFLQKNDFLKAEISSVESFNLEDRSSIPIIPSFSYSNKIFISGNPVINRLNFDLLKRDKSNANNPSEIIKIDSKNQFIINDKYGNIKLYNKVNIINSYSSYYFDEDISDFDSLKSFIILSSDLRYQKFINSTPRLKFILPIQLINSEKKINEDSNSITFNYQNQYNDDRFFGSDIIESTPRIVYGIENEIKIFGPKLNFNINQSYDLNHNNSYATKVNQKSHFSDYSFEAKTNLKNLNFKIDARFDEKNLSKKEMNYTLSIQNPLNFSVSYNETQKESFQNLSNDTQALDIGINKKLNDNVSIAYSADLDVKNNYDPYKSTLMFSFFDECSQLNVAYTNTRFNDNFNTKPEEIISLSFRMDYLGFFNYEQKTDLFFSEPGNINYGL